MRLEETAAFLFGATVFVAVGAFFAVSFWDSLVAPAVELAGATIFAVRFPVTLGLVLLLFVTLFRRFRRYR